MQRRRALWFLIAAGTAACGLGSEGPETIAEQFWAAGRDGDVELARTYVVESGSASLINPDDFDGPAIADFSLGETQIDGDEATVATHLVSTDDDHREVDFDTHLVRADGAWKIDLDKTTGEMLQAILGVAMGDVARQMGEALGEAMGEAMRGAMEGMAEGLSSAVDSLNAREGSRR